MYHPIGGRNSCRVTIMVQSTLEIECSPDGYCHHNKQLLQILLSSMDCLGKQSNKLYIFPGPKVETNNRLNMKDCSPNLPKHPSEGLRASHIDILLGPKQIQIQKLSRWIEQRIHTSSGHSLHSCRKLRTESMKNRKSPVII